MSRRRVDDQDAWTGRRAEETSVVGDPRASDIDPGRAEPPAHTKRITRCQPSGESGRECIGRRWRRPTAASD